MKTENEIMEKEEMISTGAYDSPDFDEISALESSISMWSADTISADYLESAVAPVQPQAPADPAVKQPVPDLAAYLEGKKAEATQTAESGEPTQNEFLVKVRKYFHTDKKTAREIEVMSGGAYTATFDGLEVLSRVCVYNRMIPSLFGTPSMPRTLQMLYEIVMSRLGQSQTTVSAYGLIHKICQESAHPELLAVDACITDRWEHFTKKEEEITDSEGKKTTRIVNKKPPKYADDNAAFFRDYVNLWDTPLRTNIMDGEVWYGWNMLDDTMLLRFSQLATALAIPLQSGSPTYDMCKAIGADNNWNPYREWLLEKIPAWDGHDYISDLCQYITDKDGVFPAAIRVWLHTLVNRILHGGQGISLVLLGDIKAGKSTFAKYLASALPDKTGNIPAQPKTIKDLNALFDLGVGTPEKMVNFFSDKKYSFDSSDDYYNLSMSAASNLIMEIPEYEMTTKALAKSKAFLTSSSNSVRKKYNIRESMLYKTANFILTCNPKIFVEVDLHRYLGIRILSIDWNYLQIPVAQIYAQALHNVQSGYAWELTAAEAAEFERIMKESQEESDFTDWIQSNFDIDISHNPKCKWFVSNDALRQVMEYDLKRMPKKADVTAALLMLGAKQTDSAYQKVIGKTARGWQGITPKPALIKRIQIKSGIEKDGHPTYEPLFGDGYSDRDYLATGQKKVDEDPEVLEARREAEKEAEAARLEKAREIGKIYGNHWAKLEEADVDCPF